MPTIRDTRSYETQIIDAVRSVNRALGGTVVASSATYKSDFNQYEIQLIDAIRSIGLTLSGSGLSLAGGGIGGVSAEEFEALSRRVTKLENESFFRLVDGNVTLKEGYSNLWVPGWLAAGGVGTGGGGGGGSVDHLYDIGDVSLTSPLNDGDALIWDATNNVWTNGAGGGGGGSGTVTSVTLVSGNGITVTNSGTAITTSGSRTISISSSYLTKIDHGETAYGWGNHATAGYATQTWVQNQGYALASDLAALATRVNAIENWFEIINVAPTGQTPVYALHALHGYAIYSDTWVAAGGIGTGSSGGGGGDMSIYALKTGASDYEFLLNKLKFYTGSLDTGLSLSYGTYNGVPYVKVNRQYTNSMVFPPTTVTDTQYLAYRSDIPTSLKCPKKLNFGQKNYDGSIERTIEASDLDAVTISGTQTITGAKTFTADTSFSSNVSVGGHIDIGPVRLEYANEALHITTSDSTNHPTIGLYADGFVAAGGVGSSPGLVKYVSCSQSEYNSLQNKDASTIYNVGNGSWIYLGDIQLFSEN